MTNREAAIKIIRRLRDAGFEAVLAGGCVRDMLLRRRPKDYDVATSARPKQVVRLFRRTLKIGAQFGVVMVLIGREQVEVATFRSDAEYADGRHPKGVTFSSAAEDAKRRDFTINGMFYDPLARKVIDHVGGKADLKKSVIRTIGKAGERFGEDYLRMLRAVRFSTQLGFKIESKTWSAIRAKSANITKISGERICAELEGILASQSRATGIRLFFDSGLAKRVFTGLSAKSIKVAIAVLQQLPARANFILTLACIFADCSTEFGLEKTQILKLSRNQRRHLKFLLANRGRLLEVDMSLAALRKIAAETYFVDLYQFQRAIQKAIVGGRASISPLIRLKRRIKALGDIELKPRPLLNGHDLIRLGVVPGPALGQLAEEMYVAQLEGNLKTAEQARNWARKWISKHKG